MEIYGDWIPYLGPREFCPTTCMGPFEVFPDKPIYDMAQINQNLSWDLGLNFLSPLHQ